VFFFKKKRILPLPFITLIFISAKVVTMGFGLLGTEFTVHAYLLLQKLVEYPVRCCGICGQKC